MFTIPDPANNWHVPENELRAFPWFEALFHSTQDPIHHAEGDVGTHSLMVLDSLVNDPVFRALLPAEREEVYVGAVLHDVAKPYTRREDSDGRVGNPGHSPKGEIDARRILWEMGYPFDMRERVCGLIRYHQLPYWAINENDGDKRVIRVSLKTRCDLLAILARADIKGRICADAQKPLDNIELFSMMAEDLGVESKPYEFPSDHTRFVYFNGNTARDPSFEAFDDSKVDVTVMCGLPGSGKDHWLAHHAGNLPVVSLDDLRDVMEVEHGDRHGQGQVAQAAKEQAKEYLRRQQPFAWNATNLTLDVRRKVLGLLSDYGARIRIVYVEAPCDRLFRQNKDRAAVVPENAIWKMTRRWQLPDLTEGHRVEYVVSP